MSFNKKSSIVILTGAGISAESGIATFRGTDGTWENQRLEDVATPQAFLKNRQRVYQFYNERRRLAHLAQPNSAHLALSKLEAHCEGKFLLVTQNVDDLHEKAGSRQIVHMHGSLNSALCLSCGARGVWQGDMDSSSSCPSCHIKGNLRPDIVWFGEMPYQMQAIENALSSCDLFISIGTSGQVYPAAQFVVLAQASGAECIELNMDPNEAYSSIFHEVIIGPASEIVPTFVQSLLSKNF